MSKRADLLDTQLRRATGECTRDEADARNWELGRIRGAIEQANYAYELRRSDGTSIAIALRAYAKKLKRGME